MKKLKENKMPEQCSEGAKTAVGNRYDLVLIAAARIRELRKGHLPKVTCKNTVTVTALKEIEAGFIGRDYLKKVRIVF